jgi:chromosome segregation ATPase
VTDIKLLGEEAKEAEEKQIQFEGHIMQLHDEVKILNNQSKWEEEKQLKMEEEFAGLLSEKELCIQQYASLDTQLSETIKREAQAAANIENFWQKIKSMSDVVSEVKGEVKQYADLLAKQDEDMNTLEDLIKEKDDELVKNNGEKDLAIRLLEGKVQDQEAAMKRLLSEVESRVLAADEMEDLLQRKIAELQRTKENVGKLEAHSKSLLDKTLVLEEKEMRAQSDMKKAQTEAAQAAKALETQQHEFSSR